MRLVGTAGRLLAVSLGAALILPSPARADAEKDTLILYSAGLDASLIDAKDRGLRDVLRLLGDRIEEVPEEVGRLDIPGPLLKTAIQAFMAPSCLRAGVLPDADPMMGPPFYAQLDVLGDVELTSRLNAQMNDLIDAMAPVPREPAGDHAGFSMVDLDGVPLYLGAGKVSGTNAYTLAMNEVSHDAPDLSDMTLPDGATPVMAFRLDAQQLQPLLEMAMEHGGPEAAMMQGQLAMSGLAGENATTITAVVGHLADRSVANVRMARYARQLESMGVRPDVSVSADSLRRIPSDATYAEAYVTDVRGTVDMVVEMLQQMPDAPFGPDDDPLAMIHQMVGIDLNTIIDSLGQQGGTYMSETTGDGSIMSTVVYMEVRDATALREALVPAFATANELAREHTHGYVQFREREIAGHEGVVLSFPGLPVPFEICMAVADGYFYLCPSATGLAAAIEHGASDAPGLIGNASLQSLGPQNLDDAIRITFMDTPALMKSGYGLVSMGVTALANATRSPHDHDRGVDAPMPTLGQLRRGAMPSLTIMRLEGDDLVMTSQYDRSTLVNACGVMGMMGGTTGLVALGAMWGGIAAPAVGQAREQAVMVQSMAQLRHLGVAGVTYASEHGDEIPASIDVLVEASYLPAEMTHSPFGPVGDDHGDYWWDDRGRNWAAVKYPDRAILAYDRAMYANLGGAVAVLFYDGHVETLGIWELEERMADEFNEGVDFKLPDGW